MPQSIRLLPQGSLFAPFKIYELWYEATGSKVLGIGFACVRDLVSFLRYETTDRNGAPNPLIAEGTRADDTGIRHALAFGVSQSGRFLRHFLELGMNDDGHGRRVFDGVMSHVAGAGKVFANHRFGMPGRTATQHEDRLYPENWFPFGNAVTTDPFSRQDRRDPPGPCDRPAGHRDQQLDRVLAEGRLAGAHRPGRPERRRSAAECPRLPDRRDPAWRPPRGRSAPGPCVNPRNPHSATPALRALFVALEEWVTKGTAPPPSRVPRIADGTAVMADTVRMPAVPGFAIAPGANQIVPPVDWVDPPARIDNVYGTRVCAVDADGNEIAGIRLPPIAVPLGTYTGWNVYRAQPGELADRDGSLIPFARTTAEREAAGDPRPSLEERYGSREAYVAKVKAAAEALVAERLLLPADAAAYVAAAEACIPFRP